LRNRFSSVQYQKSEDRRECDFKQSGGGAAATITDVARKAGVSVSTASHALDGTRRVSLATATAVL
jgi:hypothetical protein